MLCGGPVEDGLLVTEGEAVVAGGDAVVEGAVDTVELGATVTMHEQAELTERMLRLQPPKHEGIIDPSL